MVAILPLVTKKLHAVEDVIDRKKLCMEWLKYMEGEWDVQIKFIPSNSIPSNLLAYAFGPDAYSGRVSTDTTPRSYHASAKLVDQVLIMQHAPRLEPSQAIVVVFPDEQWTRLTMYGLPMGPAKRVLEDASGSRQLTKNPEGIRHLLDTMVAESESLHVRVPYSKLLISKRLYVTGKEKVTGWGNDPDYEIHKTENGFVMREKIRTSSFSIHHVIESTYEREANRIPDAKSAKEGSSH